MNSEILYKRIEILKQIDALLPKCDCVSAMESESCSNCEEIAKLGERLLGLINKRIVTLEPKKKQKIKKGSTKLIITVFQYKEYKQQNITDKEIAKMHEVCLSTLKKWKQRNLLVS